MLNSLTYSLPENLDVEVRKHFDECQKENKISRIWAKDAGVWTDTDEAKWLGWLDSVETELGRIQEYRDFAEDVRSAGFESVRLLAPTLPMHRGKNTC
jgi:hypothetical protein